MSEPAAADEATVSPSVGRSRREGNDSLWKRARRTLGTNSLTFLQPQSRPTGMSSLRSKFPLCASNPFLTSLAVSASYILQITPSNMFEGLVNRAHRRVCQLQEKRRVQGQQIMLTFLKKGPPLLLGPVRQRQVKEGSKFDMHNGMFRHHLIP
jgi:hypothetical protein